MLPGRGNHPHKLPIFSSSPLTTTPKPTPLEIVPRHLIGVSGQGQNNIYLAEWQRMPELPTAEELLTSQTPPLPQDDGQPLSKQHYLERHYLLYRFEGTELLRRAISRYRTSGGRWPQDAFLYKQVCTSRHRKLQLENSTSLSARLTLCDPGPCPRIVLRQPWRWVPSCLLDRHQS